MSVYYNDIEPYPCKVLRARIADGTLPQGFVDERDICTVTTGDIAPYAHVHLFAGIGIFAYGFKRADVPMDCRIMTGGFPCTDISVAGKQAGLQGTRSGLWFQMVRLIQESNDIGKPFDFIVIENVRNLLSGGDYYENTVRATDSGALDETPADALWQSWMGTVLADLAEVGYDSEWKCLRASDYGAPHRRERVFIVAYPNSDSRGWTQRAITRNVGSAAGTHIEREGHSQRYAPQCGGTAGMAHTLNARCADTWHVSDRQVSRWEEPGWEQSADRAGRSGESEQLAYSTESRRENDLSPIGVRHGFDSSGQCALADAASGERTRGGNAWTGRDEPANVGTLEYPDRQRCEEQYLAAVASPSRRTCESDAAGMADATRTENGRVQQSRVSPDAGTGSDWQRQSGIFAQSGVRRDAHGLANWLYKYRWPARPGQPQFDYEPPRVISNKVPFRNFRLKALGNALMLPIAEDIGYGIKAAWLAREEVSA